MTAEAAFDGAILSVLDPRPRLLCFTRGHGELRVDSLAVDGMSDLGEALRRANHRLRTLDGLEAGVPSECDVTVVAGPERPFTAGEVAALDALVGRGGRLLVLLGPVIDRSGGRLEAVGIEPLLGRLGVEAGDAMVLDPAVEMSPSAVAWAVDDGYADHPVTRALVGKRTVWSLARPVAATARPGLAATGIVHTSAEAWATRDLGALLEDPAHLRYDPARDLKGPFTVAVAVEVAGGGEGRGMRLVVLGSRGIARNDHDVFYNRDLVESAVEWLGGARRELGIAPRVPSQLRLALDERELGRVFWICVVAVPLACVFLGVGVWWRRRA